LLSVYCIVPRGASAALEFFDLSGRIVGTVPLDTGKDGEIQAVWDGRNTNGNRVASGVYYCRLKTDSGNLIQPVIMLR
jgi:flagellar hook assembly protein FlgD